MIIFVCVRDSETTEICPMKVTVGENSMMLSFVDNPEIIDVPLEGIYAVLKEADEKRRQK